MEPNAPPGWHPDPTGRFEFRFFNGQRWTSDVSLHGQRYIDQLDAASTVVAAGWAQPAGGTRPPSRAFAIAAFVVGLVSFAIAWIPFVFAIGACGAIAAIVFGIIALRRIHREEAAGRGYAVVGILLSVMALAASVVGFVLTRNVWREFRDYLDEGPHTERIVACSANDGLVTLDGSITNQDTSTHDYTIHVSYRVGGDAVDSDSVNVVDVAAGSTATFQASAFVITSEPVTCTIDSVTGPEPFLPQS